MLPIIIACAGCGGSVPSAPVVHAQNASNAILANAHSKIHLYVADFSADAIDTFDLPIISNEPPSAPPLATKPAGAHPIALSVDASGDVFYAANESAFLNIYIGECSNGKCRKILTRGFRGLNTAATGIAVDATGSSGYIVYGTNPGPSQSEGVIERFKRSGHTWSFGRTLIEESQPSEISLPGFPFGTPFTGGSLNHKGDLAVAMPFGLTAYSQPPGLAVFARGSAKPSFYPYGGGQVAPVATAWEYGSSTIFYGLYVPATYTQIDGYISCTVGASCAPPNTGIPVMTQASGIAVDAQREVYMSTLGTLGSPPNPFPPVLGSQIIFAVPFATGSQEAIRNNRRGKPFKAPWGLALGP